ncbi:conserved hypothetical protein, partial [Ricinus communis]
MSDPNSATASAGSSAQPRMANPSFGPRRKVTRPTTAALTQAKISVAIPRAATAIACVRPRMTNSASARMAALVTELLIREQGKPCSALLVLIRIGQQREVAGALDAARQLALVFGLGAGDAARNDLAGFGNVGLQGFQILVVDLFDAFS